MSRRRRASVSTSLTFAATVTAGSLWLWSQPWGRILVIWLAAGVTAAGIARLTTASSRHRQRRRQLSTLQGLLELTPAEFEQEVAGLLHRMGFSSVTAVGGAGDLQADIVALDPDGLATVVQCKRYAPGRTVGSPVIQSFIGMARVHHNCDRAMVVTTGSFTVPARLLAEEHDIELIDGDGLVEMFSPRAALPT